MADAENELLGREAEANRRGNLRGPVDASIRAANRNLKSLIHELDRMTMEIYIRPLSFHIHILKSAKKNLGKTSAADYFLRF